MAFYNADGQINLTVVDGNTYTGAQAADGSWYVVLNDGSTYTGARHRCGAMNAIVNETTQSTVAPNGSMYIRTQKDGVGYTPSNSKGTTNSIAGFNNFTGSNLSNWLVADAAQKAGTSNSRIFCAGDSTTAGVGGANTAVLLNNDISYSYPTQLAAAIGGTAQDIVGDHNGVSSGTTLMNFDFRFTRQDADWFNTTNGAVGGVMLGASNASGVMIWTPTVAFDTVEVYFSRFSSTGIIIVQSDGVEIGQVNTAGATGVGKVTLTTTLGSHALSFIGNAIKAQYLIGAIAYNSAQKKPVVINGGAMGWTAGGLNGSGFNQNQWPYPAGVVAMTPDVVVELIGTNDLTNGIALSTYGGSLAAFSGKLAPTTDLIFCSFAPCLPGAGVPSYAVQQTYVDTMRDQALALNRPFIDIWRLMGGTHQASLMYDNKHPNASGYAVITAYVKRALTPGFYSI